MGRECFTRSKAPVVTKVKGREILDSRGNPTVEVDIYANHWGADNALVARAGAPSGASTGSNEAMELRDGDKSRYLGKGVLKAVEHVNNEIQQALKGKPVDDLKGNDQALIEEDGTRLKTKLGGNAITATSFAVAEAGAFVTQVELFLHLAKFFYGPDQLPQSFHLPRPLVNIINGGKHAGGELQIQEFMIIPKAGNTFKQNLQIITEVYHHLGKILVSKYGVSAKNLGDEGGYAPSLNVPDEALTLIEEAIKSAGYGVGKDVFLALDCAASEFFKDGNYEIEKGKFLGADETVEYYLKLKRDHPALISIEDPLDEKDYSAWQKLTAKFTQEFPGTMIVGDDLYTTNTDLIQKGVAEKWANTLLLKVNQIGTISEAMDAARMIFNDKGQVIVSHRSGETPNTLISDLAVAIGAGFIKTGATARGERVAKYNRLLAIEEYLQENGLLGETLKTEQLLK